MNPLKQTVRLLLVAAAIGCCTTVAAQQMPERREVRRGNRLFHREDYEESIGHYERALRAAPDNFEATYDLGNALYRAERFDQATQRLRAAAADTLRTETERAEALYNLGNAQFRQEQYREALDSYRQSLLLNPADSEAKYNYAYTKWLLDRDEENDGGSDDRQQPDGSQQQPQSKQEDDGQGQNDPHEDRTRQPEENGADPQEGAGDPKEGDGTAAPSGISPEEQERLLDAIQAQEDRTQEKLKERQGVVVRGTKNW